VYNLLRDTLPRATFRGKFSTVAVDKTVEKNVGNVGDRCHACAALLRLQKQHRVRAKKLAVVKPRGQAHVRAPPPRPDIGVS